MADWLFDDRLVALDKLPSHAGDRYKILEKMSLVPQYAWAGDHTIEAIEAGVTAVADSDSDDYFVIVITDANFERCQSLPLFLSPVRALTLTMYRWNHR